MHARLVAPALLVLASAALPQVMAPAPTTEDAVPDGLAADDWASIREAYEAGRHAAFPVEGGYEARNPGQQWRTRFDGRGFTVTPGSGAWTWGLELQSYGFAGNEQEVTSAERVSAEGGRVAYAWDATIEEWYVNDKQGLEHGYTVYQRPTPGGEGPLVFMLSVRGDLHPEVTANGHGVRFLDREGAAALNYTGLRVVDAEGRDLEARFERVSDGLRLSINECRARYPLTIDPVAQQAYLKASNTNIYDGFGWSVAVSGTTVVVSAPWEDSSAMGVNGDADDNFADASGAAYVFVRNGTSWSQQAYLKASNTDGWDHFGWAVSVDGVSLVVGADSEHSGATGVDGDQASNGASDSGAAYVFDLNVDPVAQFIASPTSGGEPLFVPFSDLSVGTGLSNWDWSFGDGGTSTLQHPTHTYIVPGTYTVSLTVVGTNGTDTETKTGYIDVNQDPRAQFVASPTSGEFELPVTFSDLSTGTSLSGWYWTFGDGGTPTEQNPSHVYVDYGDYTVSLTVTGTKGTDTETKVDYIFVHGGSTATATPDNGSGVNPNVFTSTSLPILGVNWTSQIDGGSLGASGMTLLFGYSAPFSGLFIGAGEVLIDPTSQWQFTVFATGASGITNHNVWVPNDPALVGIRSCVQGYLNNVGGSVKITNAYRLNLVY